MSCCGVQPGDYRMMQVDVERSQEFRKCIESKRTLIGRVGC